MTSYGYQAGSNRLRTLSGAVAKSYTYDAAGNLASAGGLTFTYDGRGRLTQSSGGDRYLINGIGQRVGEVGAGCRDGHPLLRVRRTGAPDRRVRRRGRGARPRLPRRYARGERARPAAAGGADIYPIYSDHLNTPRLITDRANRKVWEWATDTFGAGAADENPSGLGPFSFNLRFPGQYFGARFPSYSIDEAIPRMPIEDKNVLRRAPAPCRCLRARAFIATVAAIPARGRRPARGVRAGDPPTSSSSRAREATTSSRRSREFEFPGLKPGDRWCVCAATWREAYEASVAAPVVPAVTHEETLAVVPLAALKEHALDIH